MNALMIDQGTVTEKINTTETVSGPGIRTETRRETGVVTGTEPVTGVETVVTSETVTVVIAIGIRIERGTMKLLTTTAVGPVIRTMTMSQSTTETGTVKERRSMMVKLSRRMIPVGMNNQSTGENMGLMITVNVE